MARRPKKRRVNAKGRNIGGDAHHVRLYHWELRSAAYRSLSVGARALLIELKALYNGCNNGLLFLSVREAAKRLGASKNYAMKLFAELQDRGFIRPNEIGAFNMKAAAGSGKATSWVLTEHSVGNAAAGTKDFMRWTPSPECISRSLQKGQSVPPEGTVPCNPSSTVPPH
jgi:hypothetical protein